MQCSDCRPPCLTDLASSAALPRLLSKIGGTDQPAGQLGEAAARFASSGAVSIATSKLLVRTVLT